MILKILFVILASIAVLIGFRLMSVRAELRARERLMREREAAQSGGPVQAMVKCRVCRAYVPADAPRCSRPDCPHIDRQVV